MNIYKKVQFEKGKEDGLPLPEICPELYENLKSSERKKSQKWKTDVF